MAVISSEDMAGSPTEQWSQSGLIATRKLLVNWDDRFEAARTRLTWPGEQYPYHTDVLCLAHSVSMSPFPAKTMQHNTDSSRVKYDKAIVVINYKTPSATDPQDIDGEVISESLEPTAEFMTIDPSDFRWGSPDGDPLNEQEAPGRLIVGFDYVFSRYNAINVPNAAMALVGHVNGSIVPTQLLGLSYPIETLLYNPPTIQRTIDVDGDVTYQLTYRFTYKAEGWNRFWRPGKEGGPGYDQMFHIVNGLYRNYPLGDFSDL